MYKVSLEVLQQCKDQLSHFIGFLEDEWYNEDNIKKINYKSRQKCLEKTRNEVENLIKLLQDNYQVR